MSKPFKNGDPLSEAELAQAYQRIVGKRMPSGSFLAVARTLSKHRPTQFEFEVNRLRGFAFDLEEIGGSVRVVS